MQAKRLQNGREQSFALVFSTGDEFIAAMLEFAQLQEISSASFTAIGAFSSLTIGFFDVQQQDYIATRIAEQVEVLSLTGNIALYQGKPKIHAHGVVGKRDGSAHGGHILAAYVCPTLEVILHESPSHLRRSIDATTGLALIELNRERGA